MIFKKFVDIDGLKIIQHFLSMFTEIE